MNGVILIQLLLAHILTDFVFQPDSWVEKKNSSGIKSIFFWMHTFIAGLTTYLVLHNWSMIMPAVIIFISHAVIDFWKIMRMKHSSKQSQRRLFFEDQLLHLIVIVLLWLYLINGYGEILPFVEGVLGDVQVMAVITSLIFITQPAGVIIGKITEPLSKKISTDDSLKRAGMYIGVTERMLVFIFVLLGRYSVIGFLIAGKSILSITKDGETNARKKTEYVLIGTLISFIVAVSAGLLVKSIL